MFVVEFVSFCVATGATGWAAWRVATRLYPDRAGTRVLAAALAAITTVLVVLEGLGTIGWLRWPAVTVLTLAIDVPVLVWLAPPKDREPLRWPFPTGWTIVFGAVAVALFVMNVGRPSVNGDALIYHYPMVAGWIQDASLNHPRGFLVGEFQWWYPSNTELLHTWAVLWFRTDFLISLVSWLFFGLLMGSVYALAAEIGMRLRQAAFVTVAVVSTPIVFFVGVRLSGVDTAVTAFMVLAVLFALRWWRNGRHLCFGDSERPGEDTLTLRVRDLGIAGLAAGLALGSKYTAVPFVGAMVAIFLVCLAVSAVRHKAGWRGLVAPLIALALPAVVAGIYWYVRNLVLAGNPLYPQGILGLPDGFVLSDLTQSQVLLSHTIWDVLVPANRYLALAWIGVLGLTGVLVPIAAVANPVWLLRLRRTLEDWGPRFVVSAVLPLVLMVLYMSTPDSAKGPVAYPILFVEKIRYGLTPYTLLLVGFGFLLARRSPRLANWVFGAVAAAHVLYIVFGYALGTGTQENLIPAQGVLQGTMVGLAFVGVALAGVWLHRRGKLGIADSTLRGLAVAAGVVFFGAGLVASWVLTHQARYAHSGNLSELAYTKADTWPSGTGVAYTSNVFNDYPLFGTNLQNRVALAADEPVRGTYTYFADADALVSFMEREDMQYLVVRDWQADTDQPAGEASTIRGTNLAKLLAIDDSPEHKAAVDELLRRYFISDDLGFARSRPDRFTEVANVGSYHLFAFSR